MTTKGFTPIEDIRNDLREIMAGPSNSSARDGSQPSGRIDGFSGSDGAHLSAGSIPGSQGRALCLPTHSRKDTDHV